MKPARDMQFYSCISVPVCVLLSFFLTFSSVQKCSLLIVNDRLLASYAFTSMQIGPRCKTVHIYCDEQVAACTDMKLVSWLLSTGM